MKNLKNKLNQFYLIVALIFFYFFCVGSIAAFAQDNTKPGIIWKYEFTDDQNTVMSKKEDILTHATQNKANAELKSSIKNGKPFVTVTLTGSGSIDDLKKTIFDPNKNVKNLIMQPAKINMQGSVSNGKTIAISLPRNITTGYKWELDNTSETNFEEYQQSKFEQTSPLLGGQGAQTIYIRALNDSSKQISMFYNRLWEASNEPQNILNIEVAGDIPDHFDLSDTTQIRLDKEKKIKKIIDLLNANPFIQQEILSPDVKSEILVGLPASYDLRASGSLTSIKNQQTCGSCWSFATVGVLEGVIKKNTGIETDLSEQFLVSCNKNNWSCDGGWVAHDYHKDKIATNQTVAGAALETDMPYTNSNGYCQSIASHPYALATWGYIAGGSSNAAVADIKNAIYNYGPVFATVCVGDNFSNYSGGVFSTNESATCGQNIVNHAVILVGWNDSDQTWILRNSWGTGWGESGYMYIRWGTSNIEYATNYITYKNSCSYTINPSNATVSSSGGTNAVSVTTQSGCKWTAGSNVSWASIASGSNGEGSGTVNYTVSPNTGSARTGTLTVAGNTFTITQSGAPSCSYDINPASYSASASGGTTTVSITTQGGCSWTASSSLGWVSITSSSSGNGNGSVTLQISPNTETSSRTGTINIAGKNFTISQSASGSCTFSLNSLSNSFSAAGGSQTVSVLTQSGCAWTAASNSAWISITTGGSGSGNGNVNYSVSQNTSTNSRTGSMTIGGQVFEVNQQGASSTADIELQNNVPVTQSMTAASSLSSWQYFYLTLPGGVTDLTIDTSNMNADIDLYVLKGTKPSWYSYDCWSSEWGATNEQCNFSNPSSGQWWIGVNNWDTGNINYTIKASWGSGGSTVSIGEAVDNTSLSWTTSGNSNWYGQTSTYNNGGDAARSGKISDYQSTLMQTTITGPGTLTFNWKVSSEADSQYCYDYLTFYIDSTEMYWICGEKNWSQRSYEIPSGTHTLQWIYVKDEYYSQGSDAGFVDAVTFQSGPAPSSSARLITCDLNGDFKDDIVKIDSNGNIFYSTNLSNWTQINGQLSKDVACGDLNNDGMADIAGIAVDGLVWYTLNKGSNWGNIPGALNRLFVSDIDGDGKSDVIGLTSSGYIYVSVDLTYWYNIPGILATITPGNFSAYYIGNEIAGLTSSGYIYITDDLQTWYNVPGVLSNLFAGDLNGDGKTDLIGLNPSNQIFYTTNLSTWTNIPGGLVYITTGDFNFDGKNDIIGLNSSNNIYYSTNLATWTNIPGQFTSLATGDFNGDGKDDVAGVGTDGNIYYTTNLTNWNDL